MKFHWCKLNKFYETLSHIKHATNLSMFGGSLLEILIASYSAENCVDQPCHNEKIIFLQFLPAFRSCNILFHFRHWNEWNENFSLTSLAHKIRETKKNIHTNQKYINENLAYVENHVRYSPNWYCSLRMNSLQTYQLPADQFFWLFTIILYHVVGLHLFTNC